ncbi:MAG TPA: hypothetical protein VNB68_00755 [Nitrososphaeraceae archaeon]|nr:hypothetical protein [Nitrososphaeraceae archaeon]
MNKLKSSYLVDGVNATKSGPIDCLFLNNPMYLLIDEIDKMTAKGVNERMNHVPIEQSIRITYFNHLTGLDI